MSAKLEKPVVKAEALADRSRRSGVVATDPTAAPAGLEKAVVAIGNFDGVHRGHAAVIGRARALATRLGRPLAIVTFEPHPADFFAGKSVVYRLTPAPARERALARLGIDGLIVLTFDRALAALTPEEFAADILVRRLGISAAVIGYDFRFGHGGKGTAESLAALGETLGFAVEIVQKVAADAQGSLDAVHSSGTRAALERGDPATAARLLGHPYFVQGEVVHGQKLGRELGFPTANLVLDASCRLRQGIYAVWLTVDGKTHPGVASYGRRPTFDNGAALLETYIFDFSGDLYGKIVEVAFVEWIRGEEKFASAEALIEQMRHDAARAREILGVEASSPPSPPLLEQSK